MFLRFQVKLARKRAPYFVKRKLNESANLLGHLIIIRYFGRLYIGAMESVILLINVI